MSVPPPEDIEIRRCRRRSQGDAWLQVLSALDIPHRFVRHEEGYSLRVPFKQARRAQQELEEFEAEERDWPPPDVLRTQWSGGAGGAVIYCYVLLAAYAAERYRFGGFDWLQQGRAHALSLLNGEWWRAATALCLHADLAHLAGNLFFGSLFGFLLSRELGPGLAWLAVVLAGSAGNAANALLQDGAHRSIGASTGVFAAVSLVMALQWGRYGRLHPAHLRRWTPAIIGLFFLGYLGTSGENTDIMAHVCGAASGAILGLALNRLPARRPSIYGQTLAGAAALAWLGLCWYLALEAGF